MSLTDELAANKRADDPSADDDNVSSSIAIREDGFFHGFTTSGVSEAFGGVAIIAGLATRTSGGSAAHHPGPPIAYVGGDNPSATGLCINALR
jgi:hypothetical protein